MQTFQQEPQLQVKHVNTRLQEMKVTIYLDYTTKHEIFHTKINFYHHTDICQIRLDFNSVTMAQPATTGTTIGTCSDEVKATSPTSFSPPTICGTLTGTHSENI